LLKVFPFGLTPPKIIKQHTMPAVILQHFFEISVADDPHQPGLLENEGPCITQQYPIYLANCWVKRFCHGGG
jgi:hypothetical protein